MVTLKSDLIAELSAKHPHIAEHHIANAVRHIIQTLTETLAHNGRIEVRGFGSLCLRYSPERWSHNPRTGEKVLASARYRPHFKPGKELRERVNNSTAPISESHESEPV